MWGVFLRACHLHSVYYSILHKANQLLFSSRMWGILFDVSKIHCVLEFNPALSIKMWGIGSEAERVSCILTCNSGSIITGVGGKYITTAYHKSFGEDISKLNNEIERTRTLSGSDKEIVRDWTWG